MRRNSPSFNNRQFDRQSVDNFQRINNQRQINTIQADRNAIERANRSISPITNPNIGMKGPNEYVMHTPRNISPIRKDIAINSTYDRNHNYHIPENYLYRDHTTYLYTRPYYDNYFYRYYVPGRTYVIFVKINNNFAYDIGLYNNTLVQVSNNITALYPNAYRYSDNVFAIPLFNATPAEANAVATNIFRSLNSMTIITPEGLIVPLNVSVFVTGGYYNSPLLFSNAANAVVYKAPTGLTLI